MNLINNMIVNLYSIIILIIVYYEAIKSSEKDSFQHKLFIKIVIATFIMLVVDTLSRFDGNPGTIYTYINHYGNFILFSINPIVPSLWLQYVHYQIFYKKEKTKRLFYPLLAVNLVNLVLLILTQSYGWYYYIDASNIYHRGPLFLISSLFTIILICVSFILILFNRKNIEKKFYHSLLLFSTLPVICLILQILFYGTSLMLNGITLSILIVFISIQKHSMYTDYLTGLSNRIRLEIYLKEKIDSSEENNTFSAIMIDLNEFKSINDNYGHDVGDEALKDSANLLKNSVRLGDFVARYGGDEFWIVFNTSDKFVVEAILNRIRSSFENYNLISNKPYDLSFSYGYGVYDYNSNMDIEEFKRYIDCLMYENKKENKKR